MANVTPRRQLGETIVLLHRTHHRAGQTALLALFVLLIIAFAGVTLVAILMGSMHHTELAHERVQAQCLAEMGIDHALEQLNGGDWLQEDRPIRYASEKIPDVGSFEVEVADVPGRAEMRIIATGREASGRRAQVTVRVAKPTELTRHIRNVYNYDYARDRLDKRAIVEFGTGGVGASGIVEELVTIPASGKVTLACVSDPAFGGLVPGSESVTTWFGERYRRREIGRAGRDEYVVDYLRAQLIFSPFDAGQKLSVFYDYLRRVPRPPGPYVFQLPYTPARDGSEIVCGPAGQSFFRDRVFPQLQDPYFFEADTGMLRFSANPKDRQNLRSLAAEWTAGAGGAWHGDTYDPPGHQIDVGRIGLPQNGVIYAEGNVRVRGRLPRTARLTVVSGGTIYIEGNLEKSDPRSTLALLADEHVCINAGHMRPKISRARLQLYVAALIYARRGSFAVVPGGGDYNELVVYGAINENHAYPNAEWAKAFSAIEHVYDAAHRDRARRPPNLVVPLSWHQGPPMRTQ